MPPGRCRAGLAGSGSPWQFALSATDANRFVLRFARHLTGRPGSRSWTAATTAPSTRRSPCSTAAGWCPGRGDGSTGRRRCHHPGRAVQRPRRARPSAGRTATSPLLLEPALTNVGIVMPDRRLPRGRSATHPPGRRVARARRDAHALRGPRRARPPAWGLDPDFPRDREADRWRSPVRGVRPGRRARRPARAGRFTTHEADIAGHRRHLGGECPRPGGGAGGAPTCAARRTSPSRCRSPSGSPPVSPASSPSTSCPGTSSGSAAGRSTGSARRRARRRRGDASTRSSRAHAPVGPEPRRAADAVPQHGALLARTTPIPTSTGTPRSSGAAVTTLLD